jgi:hypothetical protein
MTDKPFPDAAADYRISDGEDFTVTVNAKDFPKAGPDGEFRVYRVYGDVTKPRRLEAALGNLLASRGVQRRAIRVSL